MENIITVIFSSIYSSFVSKNGLIMVCKVHFSEFEQIHESGSAIGWISRNGLWFRWDYEISLWKPHDLSGQKSKMLNALSHNTTDDDDDSKHPNKFIHVSNVIYATFCSLTMHIYDVNTYTLFASMFYTLFFSLCSYFFISVLLNTNMVYATLTKKNGRILFQVKIE